MDDEETNSLIAWKKVANSEVEVALVTLLFVPESKVEKKFVVVAAVPVAFWKVKFCKVVEPVRRSEEKDTEEVEMSEPTVNCPIDEEETNSLMARNMVANSEVEVALVSVLLVAKRAVVDALVVVALSAMKVEEAKNAV